MENLILQKRKMVQDRIEKSFNSGLRIPELQGIDINKSLDTDIEKAYSVGQSHPKHPDWLWTDLGNGKFDWKSKNGKWWKGKTGNVATPSNGSGGSTSTANSGLGSNAGNTKPTSTSHPHIQKLINNDCVFGVRYTSNGHKIYQATSYKDATSTTINKTEYDWALQNGGQKESDAEAKDWADKNEEAQLQKWFNSQFPGRDLDEVISTIENSNNNLSKTTNLPKLKRYKELWGDSRQRLRRLTSDGKAYVKDTALKSVAQKKFDSDVVEHVNELVKKIGKDKALERFEKYVKEYGDDGTKFGAMMKYKYSQAAEYLKKKTESDFKKNFKDAKDDILQQVVSGKIQASADEKKWAKDLLDERKAATTVPAKIDYTVDKEIYDRVKHVLEAYTVDTLEKRVKSLTDDVKACEQNIKNAKTLDDFKFHQENLTANISRKKAAEDVLAEKKAKVQNTTTSSANVDSKQDKAAQSAGFKDYKEMKAWQDYGTAKQLLKKELTHRKQDKQKIADLKEEIATYEKNHADVIAAHDGGKKTVDNKTAQKPKSAAKTFADKIMERANSGFWGKLSDDEKTKLENSIKNDKASINDLLLAKFPAATATNGFSDSSESDFQLANGKELKLIHTATIQTDRIGQEYTKHYYQITDLYKHKVYGSSQSAKGYTTPAQAKQETINQALYSLFAKK